MTSMIILLRIVISTILGGLVGIEREIHGRAAGLRTHILVCMGSTLFMITSVMVSAKYGAAGASDPSRIAAGVVTGIGFLGAGAIIRYGSSIKGLTTAASIWAVSAIGLAVGAGIYEAAVITTIVVLAVLILSRWEERMELKRPGKKLTVRVDAGVAGVSDNIKTIIGAHGGLVKGITSNEANNKVEFEFDLTLLKGYNREIEGEIASLQGVEDVSWK